MAGNRHKQIKEQALKRKTEAAKSLGRIGLRPKSPFISVGVILEHLGMSQLNFFGLNNINQFCRDSLGVDVALIVQHMCRPCIVPLCPIHNVQHLVNWPNPLVATSTSSCLEALTSEAPVVLHYVFDVDFANRRDLIIGEIQSTFCDPRVLVVTRGEDYRRLVESEFGIKVRAVLPNFEFERMLQILVPLLNEPKGERDE